MLDLKIMKYFALICGHVSTSEAAKDMYVARKHGSSHMHSGSAQVAVDFKHMLLDGNLL